jgi:hypothetical protein
MKSFQSLVVMLAALIMINTSMVAGSSSSDVAEQQLSQLEQIQIGTEDERKRMLGKSVQVILPLWNEIRTTAPTEIARSTKCFIIYQ